MMLKKIVMRGFLMSSLLVSLGCVHTSTTQNLSLYEQLGKYEGIESIVHELIYVIAEDDRIKDRYRGVNMNKFKAGLSDYICSVVGGPCEYKGDSVEVIHAGHHYTNTDFNALVGDLIKAMERKNIPVATQNQLLSVLASSYKDVVYH